MQHDKQTGDSLVVCDECGELFNWRSGNLTGICPTCEIRRGYR